jgi:hypothetical protein
MTYTSTTTGPGPRIALEQRTMDAMLDLYCSDLHGGRSGLCADCTRLRDYAHRRLDICPFQEHKPVCNRCTVHCYSQSMRERVREVMRYAGPRMPWRHPWLALLHLLDKRRGAPRLAPRARDGAGT